jgi:hypothetical protein
LTALYRRYDNNKKLFVWAKTKNALTEAKEAIPKKVLTMPWQQHRQFSFNEL